LDAIDDINRRLALLGTTAGVIGFILLSRLLTGLLFGVRPLDIETLSFAILTLGAVTSHSFLHKEVLGFNPCERCERNDEPPPEGSEPLAGPGSIPNQRRSIVKGKPQ
jgi:hypothetical protein